MSDRRGAPITGGLGTTTLIVRGYGGDAFEQGLEIRTATTAPTAIARATRAARRAVRIDSSVPAAAELRTMLLRGRRPWLNW